MQQEMFDEALRFYNQMIQEIIVLYNKGLKDDKTYNLTLDETLIEIDCFLQAILLKLSFSDETTAWELYYIKKLTDYGDLFQWLGIDDENFIECILEYCDDIKDLVNEEFEKTPLLFNYIKKMNASLKIKNEDLDNSLNAMYFFVQALSSIMVLLMGLDETISDEEIVTMKEILIKVLA